MTMQMKVHDLEPDLVMTVEDAAGVAHLADVVSWRIIGILRGEVVVDGAPTTTTIDPGNASKMTLTREWVAGETAKPGEMRIEVEAIWPGGRPQTFPPMSYATVRFNTDLA